MKKPQAQGGATIVPRPQKVSSPDRKKSFAAAKTAHAESPAKARRSHKQTGTALSISSWSALEEYLRLKPDALKCIRSSAQQMPGLQDLLNRHQLSSIPCTEDTELTQGFSAEVVIDWCLEDELLATAAGHSSGLIVACDHITDTRNLGALARSAAFFGVQHLLLPKDRQAPITSATLASAQGAFAQIRPTMVTNLNRTLQALKVSGYWIAAASMGGTPPEQLKIHYEKMVLVLGAEDKGISAQILKNSDLTLGIPNYGGQLESLNVAVAAGILLHGIRVQEQTTKKN